MSQVAGAEVRVTLSNSPAEQQPFGGLCPAAAFPFGERTSDLRLEGELSIERLTALGPLASFAVVQTRLNDFCEGALKYAQEYFRGVTGNNEYFNKHVEHLFVWMVRELVTNELYHGVLGFDSIDKCSLISNNEDIKALYGNDIDPDVKRQELEDEVAKRVMARSSKSILLNVRTGTDEEGRSFFEVSVGSPREFDLAAALQRAKDLDASIEKLFEEDKSDEAMALLEQKWGRGLFVMDAKLKSDGDSLRQDPLNAGPVIARKRLPEA